MGDMGQCLQLSKWQSSSQGESPQKDTGLVSPTGPSPELEGEDEVMIPRSLKQHFPSSESKKRLKNEYDLQQETGDFFTSKLSERCAESPKCRM